MQNWLYQNIISDVLLAIQMDFQEVLSHLIHLPEVF